MHLFEFRTGKAAAIAFAFLFPLVPAAEDYLTWSHSARMAFNTTSRGAGVTGNVSDFPVFIRLDKSWFPFAQAQSGGGDIRFADGDGASLAYEIEAWDSLAGTAAIWVRVPKVDGNSDQDYIKMYWGKSGAVSASNGKAVFDTAQGFAGVWHLSEEAVGVGTVDLYQDATANGNHGDDSILSINREGITGPGHLFRAGDRNDRVSIPHSGSLNMASDGATAITISAWFKSEGGGGTGMLMKQKELFTNPYGLEYHASDQVRFWAGGTYRNSGAELPDTIWNHLAGVYDGEFLRIYRNGAEIHKSPNTGLMIPGSGNVYIGGGSGGRAFIDEVRLSRAVRSADWLKLSYENQRTNSRFLTYSLQLPIEDYSQWTFKRKIWINTSASGVSLSADVAGFPLLLRLDTGNFNFSLAAADGADLRFSDPDGTRLPYEIESWDATGKKASLWVRIPTVNAAGGQDSLFMHWGKSGAAALSDGSKVFGSADGHTAVWHLGENAAGTGTASLYRDASGNGFHGTDKVSATDQSGIAGNGQEFGGTGDHIDLSAANTIMSGRSEVTIEYWARRKAGPSAQTVLAFSTRGSSRVSRASSGFQANGSVFLYGTTEAEESTVRTQTDSAAASDAWVHVAGAISFVDKHMKIYVNGVLSKTTNAAFLAASTPETPSLAGAIGSEDDAGSDHFSGHLDEIRVSSVQRSGDWITLSYENQRADSPLLLYERMDPPRITAQPAAVQAIAGDTVVFPVTASGTPPLHYQWLKNGASIPAANAESYSISGVAPSDSGAKYSVVVSSLLGVDTSHVALLKVQSIVPPTASPSGGLIADSLTVTLSTLTPKSVIRFTRDGSDPSPASEEYVRPIILTSTVILKAAAFRGSQRSAVASWTFTKPGEVAKPLATPSGKAFTGTLEVKLASATDSAAIHYTLDGTEPDTGKTRYSATKPISLSQTTTLKALAVKMGMKNSAILVESYVWIKDTATDTSNSLPDSNTLQPGDGVVTAPGLILMNPSPTLSVQVVKVMSDTLPLSGFASVRGAVEIRADSGMAFPSLILRFSGSQDASHIYKWENGKVAYHDSLSESSPIDNPGLYFVGKDTVPPEVRLLTLQFNSRGDSLSARVLIRDNTANPDIRLENRTTSQSTEWTKTLSDTVVLAFANETFTLSPVEIRLSVWDRNSRSYFPLDSSRYFPLPKRFQQLESPPAFSMREKHGWDLLGIPLATFPPLTPGNLARNNPDKDMRFMIWKTHPGDSVRGEYAQVGADETLSPQQAVWMAGKNAIPSLFFPAAQTHIPGDSGYFIIRLARGWNQVASPSLSTQYWPITRMEEDGYNQSRIKGLFAFDTAARNGYVASDSLVPWRGYFVYSQAPDTAVALLARPARPAVAKEGGNGSPSTALSSSSAATVSLSMSFGLEGGGGAPVRLGAYAYARQGIGVEDEYPLPGKDGDPYLCAQRDGHCLGTDIIPLRREGDGQGLYFWKMAMAGEKSGGLSVLKVLASRLPEGIEAWVVSPFRKVGFRVEPGGEFNLSQYLGDTLEVYAGTPAELARISRLQELRPLPARVRMDAAAGESGLSLRLALPAASRLSVKLRTVTGANAGEWPRTGVASGTYRLHLPWSALRSDKQAAAGLYVLRLELTGPGLAHKEDRKILVPVR